MEDAKIDFTQVVEFLQENMHKGGTVLILGARAGGFFRSQDFYNTMKVFGNPSFSQRPRVEQFAECYELLIGSGLFKWDGIDTILIASLNDVDITDADTCLAKLVKQGVFDVIVSTNVDNLLEQVLEKKGMKELYDFDVFSPRSDTTIRSQRKFSRRIIKFFGELRTRDYSYTMTPDVRLHSPQSLKGTLEKELARDIVAIGLDPVWDAEILHVIPSKGGTFWYVNDEELDEHSALYEISKERSFRYLTGINGGYGNVMKKLCELLIGRVPTDKTHAERIQADNALIEKRELIEGIIGLKSIPINSLPTETPLPAAERALEIFISYAPEDEKLCEQLTKHLSALKNRNIINMWHESRIIAGQHRQDEVDGRLNSASIILLLVSANFIGLDDYIHGVEIERAMELHTAGKARVIPILLRPVDWDGTPFEALMPLPTNKLAVTRWRDRHSAFLDIVKGIRNVIEDLQKKP